MLNILRCLLQHVTLYLLLTDILTVYVRVLCCYYEPFVYTSFSEIKDTSLSRHRTSIIFIEWRLSHEKKKMKNMESEQNINFIFIIMKQRDFNSLPSPHYQRTNSIYSIRDNTIHRLHAPHNTSVLKTTQNSFCYCFRFFCYVVSLQTTSRLECESAVLEILLSLFYFCTLANFVCNKCVECCYGVTKHINYTKYTVLCSVFSAHEYQCDFV